MSAAVTTRPARHSARARLASVACVVALAGVGASAPAQAAVSVDPVGAWDMVVQIHTDPATDASLICDFYPDHRLKCVNKPGLSEITGLGIWRQNGPTGITFFLTHHAHRDAAGNEIGKIYTVHNGDLRKNRFSTEGTTFIVLDEGEPWIGPISVDAKGKRLTR